MSPTNDRKGSAPVLRRGKREKRSTAAATTTTTPIKAPPMKKAKKEPSPPSSAESKDKKDRSLGFEFGLLTFRIVTETEKTHPHLMKWSEDGSAIEVGDNTHLLGPIMNKYFPHSNYDSFRRQMQVYGFSKQRAGLDNPGCFVHPHFHRERPDDLVNMRRRPKPGEREKAPATAAAATTRSKPERKAPKPRTQPRAQPGSGGNLNFSKDPFPILLHQIVTESSVKQPHLIRWTKNGSGFLMMGPKNELNDLMGNYFPHANVASFRRQLCCYNLSRSHDGMEDEDWDEASNKKGCYMNPLFHRDRPDAAAKITSRKRNEADSSPEKEAEANGNGKAASADDDNQDDQDVDENSEVDFDLSTMAASGAKSIAESDVNQDDSHSDVEMDEPSGDEQGEAAPPEPKFRPYQKVYARDKDGVIYEGVVRRQMFGPHHHKQVQIGFVDSSREAEELLKEDEPSWHYFIHYGSWNVNWDRWVPEESVFEPTDETKAYAARLLHEHKAVKQALTKKQKGKKGYQTIDGAEFLREWKKRLAAVDAEMKIGKEGGDVSKGDDAGKQTAEANAAAAVVTPKKKAPKKDTWTKVSLALEQKLREKNLTTKRKQAHGFSVVIPLSLKKTMVDQWEIISQCQMLPSLPSPVTIRQALDKYLESKGIVQAPESKAPDDKKEDPSDNSALKPDAAIAMDEEKKEEATDTATAPKLDASATTVTSEKSPEPLAAADSEANEWRQGWIAMANGIAMLFDEAVAARLLYRQELPQLHVLDSLPVYAVKPYSEIYGCEHLLRLFVRLPDLLADEFTDAEARPILAKVNDFLRYLNKNQPALLVQSCRKLNELELAEQEKMVKIENRKLKRQESLLAAAATAEAAVVAVPVPAPIAA